jgi:NADH-quinone oxidoreductase subunit M
VYVPGDPAAAADPDAQEHVTTWSLLTLADTGRNVPPAAVQFYVGLDGLNVWLVLLTSLMTLAAIVLSWDAATDRPGGFFAWLFVLQTGVIGAFVSFDVILFYVFFELTLIPTFFLIGGWGVGGGRRDAARKFFLYTLFGSLLSLTGLVGLVLTNPTPVFPPPIDDRPTAAGRLPGPDHLPLPTEGPVTFSIPQLMQNAGVWADVRSFPPWYYEVRANEAAREKNDARREDFQAKRAAAQEDWDRRQAVQAWLFVALMAGFAVKLPIVPFHTWLPAAYAESPTAVVMLLSAVLSKLGAFGILRLVLPLAPDPALQYGLPVFGALGAVGIVYGALCAFAQRDLKLLVAYSSVSHLGLLVLGLFAFNAEGLTGAALHMVNHGLTTGALFGLLGFLAHRYKTLDVTQYGGLIARFPGWAFLVFFFTLATVGLPGLCNFVGEMLMLAGLFDPAYAGAGGYGLAAAAVAGLFLGAWYTLTMVRRVLFGPVREPAAAGPVKGLTGRERVAFVLLAVPCLALGVYPQPVIDTIKSDVNLVAEAGRRARVRAELPSTSPPEVPALAPIP